MKANRKFSKDEEAVSPVIGVILMVAITVILAAVIAAFVFGMGSSLKKNYVVGATASQTNLTNVDMTYTGGPDHASVSYLTYSVNTGTAYQNTSPLTVGYTEQNNTVSTGREHIVVVAYFIDGTSQIILDTYV
jgi:flagellin-like protein